MTKALMCQACFAPLDMSGRHHGIIKCDYCGTSNVIDNEARKLIVENELEFLPALRKAMAAQMTLNDIKEFVFAFSGKTNVSFYRLSYDSVPGDTLEGKALGLLVWAKHRKLIQDLVDALLEMYPRFEI